MFDPIRRIPDYDALPTVPTVEAWRAMSPEARIAFQVEVNTALTPPAEFMSEGQPHKRAKSRSLDALGLHFKSIGRPVYLAEDLTVLYPNEKPFSPDLLAVVDVEPSSDEDERLSWVVAEERKGIDLALEVLHRGDRNKDLVDNVERYARVGVTEYFVYDRARQRLHGYRLTTPQSGRYQPIIPQLGHYRSGVLGLDLAIIDDKLQFLAGEATLPQSADLIRRLHSMVTNLETKASEAEAQIEEAQARAAEAQTQASEAAAKIEEAQAKASEAAAKATAAQTQANEALKGLRDALLLVLHVRGFSCPDDVRERIQVCQDPSLLRRWLSSAGTATTPMDIFTA